MEILISIIILALVMLGAIIAINKDYNSKKPINYGFKLKHFDFKIDYNAMRKEELEELINNKETNQHLKEKLEIIYNTRFVQNKF